MMAFRALARMLTDSFMFWCLSDGCFVLTPLGDLPADALLDERDGEVLRRRGGLAGGVVVFRGDLVTCFEAEVPERVCDTADGPVETEGHLGGAEVFAVEDERDTVALGVEVPAGEGDELEAEGAETARWGGQDEFH